MDVCNVTMWQASYHFFRYPQGLKLIHQEHYEFQYVHTDYECDDNGYKLIDEKDDRKWTVT